MLVGPQSRRRTTTFLTIIASFLIFYSIFLFQRSPEFPVNKTHGHHPSHASSSISSTSSGSGLPPQTNSIKTSKLHYIIPAVNENLHLCYNLLSSAANRYPVPRLIGYNETGEFSAAESHLAKLRTIHRYLISLNPQDDDDLVLAVDGYDVVQQLPPEIVLKRYFDLRAQADERMAQRLHTDVEDIRRRGLHTTLIFAANKLCGPVTFRAPGCSDYCRRGNNYLLDECQKVCLIDWTEPRCWAVPETTLPQFVYGPQTNNGSVNYMEPRWMNSGTIVGPVAHLREYLEATLEVIRRTHDSEPPGAREFDQLYLSKVWALQEYSRSKVANNGGYVSGGSANRTFPENNTGKDKTEYHIGIDYESALSVAKYGNEPVIGWTKFNHTDLSTEMDRDLFEIGSSFKPYRIQMPKDVANGLKKLYNSIGETDLRPKAEDWVRNVDIHVNFVTKNIFTLWHCTGKNKEDWMSSEFKRYWFYPLAKSLLKATTKALRGDNVLITDEIIDGRRWAHKLVYPEDGSELGGAYTDSKDSSYLNWEALCGNHTQTLFAGETE